MTKSQNITKEANDTFLTTAQAADFLNVSLSTLKKLLKNGAIRAFRTPGGHYRIYKKELIENIYEQS